VAGQDFRVIAQDRQALRRRLYDDFEFYARHALKIRTKKSEIVPFIFNEAQRRLSEIVEKQKAATGRVRVIILKSRQQGLSTYVEGRLYFRVSQRKAKKAMVVTHHATATSTLFDMTQRFHELCPEVLKPSTKTASRRELRFGHLDSGYIVATAGGDTVGRGETLTHVHASEVAFWPKSSSREIFSGLMDAVPKTDDTEVYIESTANGMTGVFYEQWQEAAAGRSEFVPVFLPWFIDPSCRVEPVKGFQRTPMEEDEAAKYDLDDWQLMFRRQKIAEKGLDLWKQEYPATPEEAFLTSGRPVFDPLKLDDMRRLIQPPRSRMAYEGGKFVDHSMGELQQFYPIIPGENYFIGADVAAGVNGDWSVAQILDPDMRQVGIFRAQVDPDYFAHILAALGRLYNDARVIVEANNHGILTVTRLYKDLLYPTVYSDEVHNQETDQVTRRLGFQTNVSTKPLIIDKLRAEVRKNQVAIYDPATLDEMRTFIVTQSGRMEADKGKHDDTVMALAMALHITEKRWVPIEVLDDWYLSPQE